MKRNWMALLAASALVLILTACGTTQVPPEKLAETFTIHKIFGSNMVLQREMPILISGTAPAGKTVRVELAAKTVYATADRRGEWTAEFPAMKAGGPYVLKLSGKNAGSPVVFNNILVGEVWLCSGQSNMQMPVNGSRFWRVKNYEWEVANANYPEIRLYDVPRKVSPGIIQSEIGGGQWVVCSPKTISPFSAAGYFFGRQIHKDLNVPVGLIGSSWGGTQIQPWISESGYRHGNRVYELNKIKAARSPGKDAIAKQKAAEAKLKQLQKAYIVKFEKWAKRFYSFNPEATKAAQAWKNASYDDSKWEKAALPGFPPEIDGIAWFRRTVQIPADWAGRDLILSLGPVDDCDETFFNGVKIGETDWKTDNYWNKPRVYTVPGKLVKTGTNIIAIRVADHFGGGGLQDSGAKMFLKLKNGKSKKISIASDWKFKLEYAVDLKKIGERPNAPGMGRGGLLNPSYPATLFNGMIAPWTRYPIRGVIWYQGCSNAGSMDYYPLHKLLIQDWRRQWKNPQMPFLLVQLAGFDGHTPKTPKADNYWEKKPFADRVPYALTREIQAEMLNLPNVGMAVAMDIGDHSDIHPADKQTVGFRLAKEAGRIVYKSGNVSQGPKFKSMKVEGTAIRVKFDNVGKGLSTKDGKKPGAFAVAGKDGKFVWADAKIDGDTIVVSSPAVKNPCHVRYAWTQYRGDVNLCNKDGFAAIPFRSDKPAYK